MEGESSLIGLRKGRMKERKRSVYIEMGGGCLSLSQASTMTRRIISTLEKSGGGPSHICVWRSVIVPQYEVEVQAAGGTRLAYWTRVKWFAEETRYHMIPGAPLCSSLQKLGTPKHKSARC